MKRILTDWNISRVMLWSSSYTSFSLYTTLRSPLVPLFHNMESTAVFKHNNASFMFISLCILSSKQYCNNLRSIQERWMSNNDVLATSHHVSRDRPPVHWLDSDCTNCCCPDSGFQDRLWLTTHLTISGAATNVTSATHVPRATTGQNLQHLWDKFNVTSIFDVRSREEWEGDLDKTSHPVDQKKWVRVRSTTLKKWVELSRVE